MPFTRSPGRWTRFLQAWPTRAEMHSLFELALPVVLVQVGMMAMGVVDTIMVGHLSAAALAAVALGNLYVFATASFGMGTLLALDPLVAQAVGARDPEAVSRALQRGLLLAVLLTVPVVLAQLPAGPVLSFLRQPSDVVPIAAKYVRISSVGIVGFLSFVVLRQSLQAIGRVGPIVLTIVLANLVNAGLNWVLIYGHLGLPPLGPVGSAWATVASRLLMGLGLVLLAWRDLSPHLESLRPEVLQLVPLWRMLRLGAPIGVQYTLEYGVFGIVGILMGGMGTDVMGAHQVTINLASITFMVPLGLSAAAAVLVGHAVGKGDRHEARRAAGAALTAGIAFMSLSAAALIAVPGLFARVYTNVESVLEIAMVLIPIAGVFQVFDAMQVVSIGILRGLGDTRTPMIINVLGFWMLGLPVGLYLGFRTPLGPAGFWWGLCVGLSVVGTFLLVRTQRRLQAEVQRVLVDGPQPQGMA